MPQEHQHSSKFYTEILERFDGVRRKQHRVALLYGILTTAVLAIVLLLFSSIIEQLFLPGVPVRTIVALLIVLAVAGAFVWLILRPILRIIGILKRETNSDIAVAVGEHFPAIHDRLLDAIQVFEHRGQLGQFFSLELIDASFADLFQQVESLDFSEAVSNKRLRRARTVVAYTAVVAVLLLVAFPSGFFGSFYRIVHYNQSFAEPLGIEFIVEPGNTQTVRGESVHVKVLVRPAPRGELALMTRPEGQIEFDPQPMKLQGGEFQTDLADLKSTTEYYASMNEYQSSHYKIAVLDRPLIRSLQLKLTPPAYTHLPTKLLDENVGDINAYPGTTVSIQLSSNKELSSVAAVFSDSTTRDLEVRGSGASGSFIVKKNKTYHLRLTDTSGLQNLGPVEYPIQVIADEFPTVEILSPAKNLDLTEQMSVDLYIRMKDDFGFTKLRLMQRLSQSRYEKPAEEYSAIDIPFPRINDNMQELTYHWDLAPFHLVPEDAVSYYVEVFDNDNVNGPKSGRSATYIVQVPSLEEVFSDVSQTHQESLESIQEAAKETKELKKEIESLQNDVKANREKMTWQQGKKAEEMVQRYESMKKKLDETAQKMDEMMKKATDNNLLSPQTMEKYAELQKLMQQLDSKELQEALKKLQQSMKELSPEQLRQAMEQLKSSEEQLRESIDRTIELLKRIHIEQKLDEIIKRADELKKQQDAIQQQTAQTKPSDQQRRNDLAQQQKDLQQQANRMEQETSQLKKDMEEFAKEMPLQEMAKAQDILQQQQLQQKMAQSGQQVQSGDMKQAQQNQQKTSEGIDQFEQQMMKAQEELRAKQMKEVVNQLRKQLDNILELSKREEAMKNENADLDPNSQLFRQGAQKQMETLSDLGNVASALSDVAKKSFSVSPEMGKEMGNALNQMNEAIKNMEARNPVATSQKQGEAMGSLNRAAMMMQSALSSLMQNGQQGVGMAGLMGELQRMAGAQSGINGGTQQAMGMGNGNSQGLSAEQQAAYERLSGQQAALQKSLKELSDEAKNTGDYSKILGDLDKVAQEMQEVQTDLEQGNVNPQTTKRQEHILSRLLESARSLRERDYEKKRLSESGKTVARTSPADIDLTTQEGKDILREELQKALEQRYSKDYEELIKNYFDQLEKEEIH